MIVIQDPSVLEKFNTTYKAATYKAAEVEAQKEAKPDKFNAAHYSTGKVGAS